MVLEAWSKGSMTKSSPRRCQELIWVPVNVLAASTSHPPPCSYHERAVEDGPKTWDPATMWETLLGRVTKASTAINNATALSSSEEDTDLINPMLCMQGRGYLSYACTRNLLGEYEPQEKKNF